MKEDGIEEVEGWKGKDTGVEERKKEEVQGKGEARKQE